MRRIRWGALSVSCLFLVVSLAAPASATVFTEARAQGKTIGFESTSLEGPTAVHSFASSDQIGEGSSSALGPAPCTSGLGCLIGGPFSFPGAAAAAEANGLLGTLKARALANGPAIPREPTGHATARLVDTVTFGGPPILKAHLDIPVFSNGTSDDASVSIALTISLLTGLDIGTVPGPKVGVASFSAVNFRDDPDAGTSFEFRKATCAAFPIDLTCVDPFGVVASGTTIPGSVDLEADFGAVCALYTDTSGSLCALPSVTFEAELTVEAICHDDLCASNVNADKTAHLQIADPFTSASGYLYPLFTPGGDGGGGGGGGSGGSVPAPAAAVLLLAGASLIALRYPR